MWHLCELLLQCYDIGFVTKHTRVLFWTDTSQWRTSDWTY